jgi:hypothetical protein
MPSDDDMNRITPEQDRIATYTAHKVVDAMLNAATEPENVDKIMSVWGDAIDKQIGRGLRRLLLYVGIALLLIAGAKFSLLEKLFR